MRSAMPFVMPKTLTWELNITLGHSFAMILDMHWQRQNKIIGPVLKRLLKVVLNVLFGQLCKVCFKMYNINHKQIFVQQINLILEGNLLLLSNSFKSMDLILLRLIVNTSLFRP